MHRLRRVAITATQPIDNIAIVDGSGTGVNDVNWSNIVAFPSFNENVCGILGGILMGKGLGSESSTKTLPLLSEMAKKSSMSASGTPLSIITPSGLT